MSRLLRKKQRARAKKATPGRAERTGHTRFIAATIIATVVAIVFAIAMLELLNVSRAYLAGESQWSRASKSAVFHLDRYAETGNSSALLAAREALATPLADRLARLELTSDDPDPERARILLERGRNHGEDVPRMVRLFPLFRHLPHFSRALEIWAGADVWIMRLDTLADELEQAWKAPIDNARQLRSIRAEIALIQETLDNRAAEFSETVSAGSRWLGNIMLWSAITVIIAVAGFTIVVFLWAMRGIRSSQKLFWRTFENAPVGMALLDSSGTVVEANDSLCRFLQRQPGQIAGRLLSDFCDARDRPAIQRSITSHGETESATGEIEGRYLRPDNSSVRGKLSISRLGRKARPDGSLIAVLEDITEAHNLSIKLAYQATHDQLTGLPNRREFERALNRLLRNRSGSSRESHAFGLIDLDQFKVINDTFGHLAGDAVLVRLAERIRLCLERQDLLARLDGDEFGFILHNCNRDNALRIANHLCDSISQFEFSWEEQAITLSASIGVVEINQDSPDPAILFQHADMACHEAKETGRNQVIIHTPSRKNPARRQQQMSWVHRLKEAVNSDRLRFHAQLIAPASEGEWRCELLVRLGDSDGELFTASEFMDAAEQYHVARTVDRWVVANALTQIEEYRSKLPGICTWHINLSGQSVDCQSVLPELIHEIERHDIPASILCFEITESAAIHSLDEARKFFSRLRQLGCQIALDDFGKGLSTFDYLKQLPIDLVKIDGGFVRDLAHSELDHAMVRSIHEVAQIAGKKTIAESVESVELSLRLRQIGIDFLQGHAIHSPVPLPSLEVPAATGNHVDASHG